MADQLPHVNVHGPGSTTVVNSAENVNNYNTTTNYGSPEPDPISFNVQSPEIIFIGRSDELLRLENAMERSPNSSAVKKIIVISGLGGIGKTQLARKFIEKHRAVYKNVIWINSESTSTIKDSFKTLAESILKIPTTNEDGGKKDLNSIVELVFNKLSKTKTLFIYDNVDKIDDVKFLLMMAASGTKMDVVVTSRIAEWNDEIDVIHLKVWKLHDAIEYVSKTLKDPENCHNDSQDDKTLLVEKLQAFPLALKQASAYINCQRTVKIFPIADYIEKYGTQDMLDSKFFHQNTLNDYEKTTFTTWRVTIDAIQRDEKIGRLALRILQIIAFFEPDNIIRDTFFHLTFESKSCFKNFCSCLFRKPVVDNEENVRSAVRLLVNYSMVDSRKQQSVLSIHRLVQQVIRLELEKAEKTKLILRDCLMLISTLEDELITKNHSHIVSVLLCALHFEDLVKKFFGMFIGILQKLIDIGKYNRAKEFGDKITQPLMRIFGEDNECVLLTRFVTSESYFQIGLYDESLRIYQEVFQRQKHKLGDEHPSTLLTKYCIGRCYCSLKKHTEAQEIFQEILKKQKNVLGENYGHILLIKHSIGYCYCHLDKHTEALETFQEVLEEQKNVLGDDHEGILITKYSIADCYLRHLDNPTEALEIFEEILEIRKSTLGNDHPDTLLIKRCIGDCNIRLGNHNNFVDYVKEIFDYVKRHPINQNEFEENWDPDIVDATAPLRNLFR